MRLTDPRKRPTNSRRVGKRKGSKRRDTAERHDFDAGGFLGHSSTYSVNVSEQLALSVDTFFACVRIIGDLVSDAVVGEFRDTDRLVDSRLTRRPMASITRRTWLWLTASTMAIYNGVYLWDRFGTDDAGIPLSIEPLPPTRVNWIGAVPYVDGKEVDPLSLKWVPRASFPTMTRELGTVLRLARDAIAGGYASGAYRADWWQEGGAPTWYVKADGRLTNTQAEEISERIALRRTTNPGRPLVLGDGSDIKQLGTDLGAGGVSNSINALGLSIARYLGIPGWLVMVAVEAGGSLTYQNAAAAGLDLVRYTLQPGYAGPIGDALSEYLPGDYLSGRRVNLDLSHLTRGTELERAQAYQIATGGRPWLLPSEVRTDIHMPPLESLDLDPAGTPAPALETIPAGSGG